MPGKFTDNDLQRDSVVLTLNVEYKQFFLLPNLYKCLY